MTPGAEPPKVDAYVSPYATPGAVIDDRYRVDRVIGRGGVGLVVAATHLGIEQRVAIKMIRDDVPMQRELLERFQREARATAMIRSEHVARVLDVGRLPTGRPYIVMEYLEGEDLDRIVARGPMTPAAAIDFTLQACEALALAHRIGIIHRDLNPANLFVARRADGTALLKVLDFGISKIQPLTAERSGRGVETTSIMGSPGYMAPEQMKSTRDVDVRADVWSLGAVLYEMLVGKPAFEGASMLEILDAIAACAPVPPSKRQAGIPQELDAVILRCLTRDPELRYAGVAELAIALSPFGSPEASRRAERALAISREPPPVAPALEVALPPLRSDPRPSALTVITPERRRVLRNRFFQTMLGACGFAAVAAAVYVWLETPAPHREATIASPAPPPPPAESYAVPAERPGAPAPSVWAPVHPIPSSLEPLPASTAAAPPATSTEPTPSRAAKATHVPLARPSATHDIATFGDRK
jgi:eukaryotic-like serine/threonine-protein kinase